MVSNSALVYLFCNCRPTTIYNLLFGYQVLSQIILRLILKIHHHHFHHSIFRTNINHTIVSSESQIATHRTSILCRCRPFRGDAGSWNAEWIENVDNPENDLLSSLSA